MLNETFQVEVLDITKYGFNFTLGDNTAYRCGFKAKDVAVNATPQCYPDDNDLEQQETSVFEMLPPAAAVWMVYKILFIGVNPVDMLVNKLFPERNTMLFQQLTEPTMACFPAAVKSVELFFVKIGGFFRYKIVPNSLLYALASIRPHPDCFDNHIIYRWDRRWGWFTHYYVLADLVTFIIMYVIGILFAEKCLVKTRPGSCCYALYWHFTSLLPMVLGVVLVCINVNWELLLPPWGFELQVILDWDFEWLVSLDVVQILLYCIAWMEFTQLVGFIFAFVWDKCADKCGVGGTLSL